MKRLGYIEALISAITFGTLPFITKTLLDLGISSTTAITIRMLMGLPIFFLLQKFVNKKSLTLTKDEFRISLLCSFFLSITTLLLFLSYEYISTGSATSIHFLYPVIIFIFTQISLKERPSTLETLAILFSIVGVFLINDFSQALSLEGIILALSSAITYALYSLFLERAQRIGIKDFRLAFYLNIFGSLFIYLIGFVIKSPVTLCFPAIGWLYLSISTILVAILAGLLFQQAIHHIGAKRTAILSTFEPITSLVLGYFLLKENVTILQILGCAFILIATIALILRPKCERS
ncbi:DMT family transporter [Guggenheimella bovis]